MALIGSFVKQPVEIWLVDISYATFLGARTASSITPTTTTPVGQTLAGSVLSGQTLQLQVAGGTDGQSYRWVVTTDLVIGGVTARVQDEFDCVVTEVPNT